MPEPITRDRIIEALREMPADATIEMRSSGWCSSRVSRLGSKQLDAGDGVPHDDARRRLHL